MYHIQAGIPVALQNYSCLRFHINYISFEPVSPRMIRSHAIREVSMTRRSTRH